MLTQAATARIDLPAALTTKVISSILDALARIEAGALTASLGGKTIAAMDKQQTCASCGRSVQPGTRWFLGRRRLDGGEFLCAECAADREPDLERRDVPITMPNTNFPNTH